MTAVTGGTVTGDGLGRMLDAMRHEDWYDEERFEDDAVGLGALHHGDRDPEGHTAWQGSRAAGVIDGAISNLAALGWDHEDLFERFLDDPVGRGVVGRDDERAVDRAGGGRRLVQEPLEQLVVVPPQFGEVADRAVDHAGRSR